MESTSDHVGGWNTTLSSVNRNVTTPLGCLQSMENLQMRSLSGISDIVYEVQACSQVYLSWLDLTPMQGWCHLTAHRNLNSATAVRSFFEIQLQSDFCLALCSRLASRSSCLEWDMHRAASCPSTIPRPFHRHDYSGAALPARPNRPTRSQLQHHQADRRDSYGSL